MSIDLSNFSKKELLEIAIKSEVDAANVYRSLIKKTSNLVLIDHLKFLADEEEKHKWMLERIFKEEFLNETPTLPPMSVVPLPTVKITENKSLPELLKEAMDAERAAEEFYKKLAERYTGDKKELLLYLSVIEQGHYFLLSNEYHLIKSLSDYEKIL